MSGNNLQCQNKANVDDSSLQSTTCDVQQMVSPPTNTRDPPLTITSVLRANDCPLPPLINCPSPDGRILVLDDSNNGEVLAVYDPKTGKPGGTVTFHLNAPAFDVIRIAASAQDTYDYKYESAQIVNVKNGCSGNGDCTFIMNPPGTEVEVNFYYACDSIFC